MNPEAFVEVGIPVNPFPGLRPFEFDESHLFFGRDGQSEQLITKLGRTHFLAVVGTSGSGKSSLVRAGLMPSLLGGFMSKAGSNWRIALMRPGNDPIGNLARALNAPDVFGSEIQENAALQTALAEATLRRGSRGLVDAIRQAVVAENENVLVIVDQFEEIFRFARVADDKEYGNEAAAFLKLLLEAANQREIPVYVVLTMRSDYLGDCSKFWGLPEAINESQYLIPRLTRDQLREAMVGPVSVAQGRITPRLVARLLNDIGDNQDQLPVLQHLLMRMWDEWKEKRLAVEVTKRDTTVKTSHEQLHQGEALDVCCYDAVGGMAQALSRHADEAFNELPSDRSREVAEKIFKALTEKGTDNREIRRPVTLAEICAVVGAMEAEVTTVVETFRRPGRSFLMPPASVVLTPESLIDISHESLIRGWARLKQWVDEEARSARIYLRVAETAVLHREGNAGLWRDPDLQIALTWREQSKPNDVWARRYHPEFNLAMSFLDASVAARDAEVREKEERRKKEIYRTRLTAVIMFVAALASLGAGGYAFAQSRKARSAQQYAETQAQLVRDSYEEAEKQKGIALGEKATAERAKAGALESEYQALWQRAEAVDATRRAEASAKEAQNNLIEANKQKTAAEAASQRVKAEALKGQGLSALKEGNQDEAIKYFTELRTYYEQLSDTAGQSLALTNLADIYKERLPISFILLESSQPQSGDDLEDDEGAQYMRQYYQSYFSLAMLQDEGEEGAQKKMETNAQEATKTYSRALELNQSASNKLAANDHALAVDLAVKRGYILENLGDLTVFDTALPSLLGGYSPAKREAVSDEQEAKALESAMTSYTQARVAYQQAGNLLKEAELLKKMAGMLHDNLSSLTAKTSPADADPKKQTVDSNQAAILRAQFQRLIKYYEEARELFRQAQKPLREASVLIVIAQAYRDLPKESGERANVLIYLTKARDIYQSEQSFSKEGKIQEEIVRFAQEYSDIDLQIAASKTALVAYRKAVVAKPKQASQLDQKISELLKSTGELIYNSGGKEAANSFFDETIAGSRDPNEKASLLGTASVFYQEKNLHPEAIRYLREQRDVYKQLNKSLEEGHALFKIGELYSDAEQIPEMSEAFDAALTAYRRVEADIKDPAVESILPVNLMKIAESYAGVDKQKSIAIYEETLDLIKRSKYANRFWLTTIVSSVGKILLAERSEQGNARAKQFFAKTIDNFRERGYETELTTKIGDVYKGAGDKKEARASYDLALNILRDKEFASLDHVELYKKIAVLETQGSPEKRPADFMLAEAESARVKGDVRSQAVAFEVAAMFFREAGESQTDKAIDYFNQARALYHQLGLKTQEASVLRSTSYLYDRKGENKKAAELRKEADQLIRPD